MRLTTNNLLVSPPLLVTVTTTTKINNKIPDRIEPSTTKDAFQQSCCEKNIHGCLQFQGAPKVTLTTNN